MAFANNFVAYPEDQNNRQKKGQIDADKPRKRDGNHGLVEG